MKVRQTGKIFLECDDEREIEGEFYITSCTSGSASGVDNYGNKVKFKFSKKNAKQLIESTKKLLSNASHMKTLKLDTNFDRGSVDIKNEVFEKPNITHESRPDDIAIVIGIQNYQKVDKESLFSVNDARLVKKYLLAKGFEERNMEYLINEQATGMSFKKTFEAWLPNNVNDNSRVFIYYSGHGAPDSKGNGYLMPFDGDPNYISVTGYPLKELYEKLGKLQAKEVVVVFDSCFSGMGGKSVLPEGIRPMVLEVDGPNILFGNVAVMTSAGMNQVSTVSFEKKHGLFTYHFMKAINGGTYNLVNLYNKIKAAVENEAKKKNVEQTPALFISTNAKASAFSLKY